MTYYALSALINGITSTILGIFVFFKNPRYIVNRCFGLYYTLSIATWSYAYFFWQIAQEQSIALFWARTLTIGAIFIPPAILHFIIHWLEIYKSKRKWIYLGYSISLIFSVIGYTNLLVSGMEQKLFFKFWPNPGLLYPFYLLFFFLYAIYTCYLMYKKFLHSTGSSRNQIKYILFGTMLGYLGGSTNFLLWYNINIPPIGNICISIYVCIVTYAIARYRLMDINIAIGNILAYVTEVVVLSAFLFLLLGVFGFKEILPMVLSSLGIAAGLIPLRTGIRRFIDKVIFKGKYDYQERLTEITSIVPTIIDQDRLIKYVVDSITANMHIEKGIAFLKDERKDMYLIQYSVGGDGDLSGRTIDGKEKLINWLKKHRDILLRYELYHVMPHNDVEELWNEIKPFSAELVVPFYRGENLIGLLCLSHKGGGDVFNQDDFRILQTIANQVAVVIENIRLYNKLIHTDRQTFLETLASGVSHEMRNRLVAIRTFIDLFPERVDLGHVETGYIEFRELAVREMARLTKIIDGLLSYSRAVSISGETLNVNDLIEETLLIIQPKLREKEINLKTNLDKNISSLTGDKGRLLQVFINIIQNAIDAMKKGGRLEIRSINKVEDVEMYITDNGKGIPKEHLDAIFEPFFTTKHTGTGLGLSIVQRIVRDHSGRISVKSEVGKGTTFIITFPKKGSYIPTDAIPKEGLRYWDVKKEYEAPEDKSDNK